LELKLQIFALLFITAVNFFAAVPDSTNSSLNNSFNFPHTLSSINKDVAKLTPEKDINYNDLVGAGAITIATGIGVHIYQANAWWRNNDSKFKIKNDWVYAKGIDKVGHFYATNLIGHAFSATLEAGNLSAEKSQLYGGIGAFAFQTFVEIEDGFGPDWGFSPTDWLFDFLGASFFVSQYYFPYLKNIQPRFSYIPSLKYRNGLHKGNMIDDYEGQKYWLSFRMKEMLPNNISKYWPSFLMLAAGVGVRELDGSGGGRHEFYIALDFDAEEIPIYGKFWVFIKNTLNYFHFPMPGIRISPDSTAFVFVF